MERHWNVKKCLERHWNVTGTSLERHWNVTGTSLERQKILERQGRPGTSTVGILERQRVPLERQ
jgi:hypothetical protein